VRAAVEKLAAREAMLDGEVAVVRPDGRTTFQGLQNALGGATVPVIYFVFDLLALDGEDLRGRPLEERKAALAQLVARAPAGGVVRFSSHVVGRGQEFFRLACERGLEGIVSKRRDQPYRHGRGPGWLKIKCVSRQELVIAGFTEPEGSREALGALVMGYYDPAGSLVFAGKVGTGFTQKLLRELSRRLRPLEQNDCPFAVRPQTSWVGRAVHWVRPELVGEVAFAEWTSDGRLRHPSFQGLREDKPAREVVRERPREE
jgi:bifunctional non-homologous end joining protein LigD